MYNEYFGFHVNPFSIAPDQRYLYLSETHQDGLAHLKYGLSSEGSITLLTGEIGTGKTTLCRFFIEQLEPTANVALIINPDLGAFEMLATICDEFMVRVSDGAFTTEHYLDALNQFLLEAHADNSPALLIIDEAQNLDKDALEMIRLLTDLETSKQKLLKIFLLGQPELTTLLLSPDLTLVNQRITGRFHLSGLHATETGEYITHRLKIAGENSRKLFSDRAVKRIHQLTGGVPRLINSLCDRSLIGAFEGSQEQVDEAMVKKAAREILGFDHLPRTIEVPVKSLVAGMLTMLAIVLVWVGTTSDFFHLNLSSVLPPPQERPTAPPVSTQQDLMGNKVVQDRGKRAEHELKDIADAQSEDTDLIDDRSHGANDKQTEVIFAADGGEQSAVKANELPSLNNIFIAPMEISEGREQEPATRIMINSIEINE